MRVFPLPGVLSILLVPVLPLCRAAQAQGTRVTPPDTYLANNRPADDRFKADILVIVAHPDDEVMAAAYIARAIDNGKRVAIVWTTHGDGGVNDAGPEQSSAMGDIRESEGMQAAEYLGVAEAWNLGGPDTPTQNPLNSLETCNHARCLERIVRLIRLTRPSIILTWLPVPVTGENHGDHQASGIMATEGFDMAGDPTAFPEQVTPAAEPNENSNKLEGLRPWQPEKIYYFSNPTHTEFFAGRGPEYLATDVSPTRHISYGEIAAREFTRHGTQGGLKLQRAIDERGLAALDEPIPLMKPTQFILGKSLAPASPTDDVFTGIIPTGLPFRSAPGYQSAQDTAPSFHIGGVWNYYRAFWQAHDLNHLAQLVPAEVTIAPKDRLSLPLIVENPTDQPIEVIFHVEAPAGFVAAALPNATVVPHSQFFVRMQADGPATRIPGWHAFHVAAESNGTSLGAVDLRVEMGSWALPR